MPSKIPPELVLWQPSHPSTGMGSNEQHTQSKPRSDKRVPKAVISWSQAQGSKPGAGDRSQQSFPPSSIRRWIFQAQQSSPIVTPDADHNVLQEKTLKNSAASQVRGYLCSWMVCFAEEKGAWLGEGWTLLFKASARFLHP